MSMDKDNSQNNKQTEPAIIKLMIVEDQQLLLDSITKFFIALPEFEVVSSLTDAYLAPIFAERMQPDVVLIDICTEEDTGGLLAAEKIKDQNPEIKIIMMTGIPEITFIDRSKSVGADGFIYKSSKLEDFTKIIKKIIAGEKSFPTQNLLDSNLKKFSFETFTKREMDILRLLCDGYIRSEIATKLNISENTVKHYQSTILNKTKFSKISKLVCFLISEGLIHPN